MLILVRHSAASSLALSRFVLFRPRLPQQWRNVGGGAMLDAPLGASIHSYPFHLLVCELRAGRYSFAQLHHDALARSRYLASSESDSAAATNVSLAAGGDS
jgi:hypothetical protein